MQLFILKILLIGCSVCTLVNCSHGQKSSNKNKIMINPEISKTDQEWKEILTPEQYYILRQKGTERPHTGTLLHNKEKGIYKCAGCGSELFTDDMKFDAHCGWPSFDREIPGGKILQIEDRSHGMVRTEIVCAKCGGHLGHIFNDGPTSTGMRYCVNSLSMEFDPLSSENTQPNNSEFITLGGGCFWCIEAVFQRLNGVLSVVSGYSGGKVKNPAYREVTSGSTGHAEVVQIEYDPKVISLESILEVFFSMHDPTTLNRQGADVGTQYRSVIFYHNTSQKETTKKLIQELNTNVFDGKVVTEVAPFEAFYKAEDYHQNYYVNNINQPYCKAVIHPKMEKLKKYFKDKIVDK